MSQFTVEELKAICEKHAKWLRGEKGGERANLLGADLQRANLLGANLQCANLQGADLQGANFQDADLRSADLWGANLRGANLQRANLQRANLLGANLLGANLQCADLQGADLDYSCLPLWCGGSRFKADSRLVRQIIAHIVTIEIADADETLTATIATMRIEASKSHRASNLGLLKDEE